MLSKILGIFTHQQISLSTPPPDKSSLDSVPVTIPGGFIACLNSPNRVAFCAGKPNGTRVYSVRMVASEASHDTLCPERESAGE